MRHGKRFNHLSRTSAHRKAMLANMASSLIIHKRIKTTVAKAKALRTYIEPLITKSKTDSTHSRRVVFSYLNDKEAVTELFREPVLKTIHWIQLQSHFILFSRNRAKLVLQKSWQEGHLQGQ